MAASALPTPELKLSTEQKPDGTVIRGTGKISSATADLLQSTIRELIPGSKRIVLDLTGVDTWIAPALAPWSASLWLQTTQTASWSFPIPSSAYAICSRSLSWLQSST